MNKQLKLETIVSEELYIDRKADEQLKQIVDDMTRPASILVSRQMGKTNLLLNIKRKYESKDMIFVYIDLSIIDNDMRDCFRYIIDTAIDSHLEIFEKIEVDIEKIREKNRLPYREHEQELLTLLQCCQGKLVIILDEIDSMTNFSFSDQFFSQIRSVYYSSRTNAKEFYNLTYLLSGVLEPADIIKNKNKSPFNISEKVYLNDFNIDEFNKFINKLNFDFFTLDITNRIYDWTNGHPRMIWNICSMLEETYIQNKKLIPDDVDDVVKFLYLGSANLAPIDHIKNLLNDNHDMVQVVQELKQEISLNITDTIKNKLYLYGIIDIENGKSKIKIKNKIINSVLNEDYLQSILYTSKTSLELAIDLYHKNEFSLALTEFNNCFKTSELSKEQKSYSNYYMANCLVKLGQYQIALETYDKADFNIETESKMYYQKELEKGICYLWIKEYDQALIQYDNVLKFKDIKIQINAYINKATVYNYKSEEKTKIEENLDSAILMLDNNYDDLDKDYYHETLAKAYFNKATFLVNQHKNKDAIDIYKNILDIRDVEQFKPNVLLSLVNIDKKNANSYLHKIFEIISKNNLKLEKINDSITFCEHTLSEYIYNLIIYNEDDLLNTVLNYCQNTNDIFKSKCSVLSLCAEKYEKERAKQEIFYLYCLNFEKDEIASVICYREIYINLIYIYYQKDDFFALQSKAERIIELFIETQDEYPMDIDDYSIINIILDELIKHKDILTAANLYRKIENKIVNNISKENIIYKALLLDKNHSLTFDLNDKIKISRECFLIIDENMKSLDDKQSNHLQYTQSVKKRHYQYLLHSKQDTLITKKLIVGRNDLCPCGSGKKYKNCCIK